MPSVSVLVVRVARPEAFSGTGCAQVGPVARELHRARRDRRRRPRRTAAVKVTGSPVVDVVSELVTAVVVVTRGWSVVMVEAPATGHRADITAGVVHDEQRQVPLAVLRPVNAPARVVWLDGVGAGAGNESAAPP